MITMIKNKEKAEKYHILDDKSINEIMISCEKYRKKLINYCRKFFECEPEYAEDCVQEAYTALLENLKSGIVINNYENWLFKVVFNHKNKVIKDKIRRNEYEFIDNIEKDTFIENASFYNPDYVENMITDEMIEKMIVEIFSKLNKREKYLYYEHYQKHRTLRNIAEDLGISEKAIQSRHLRLKQKIEKLIKEYNKN